MKAEGLRASSTIGQLRFRLCHGRRRRRRRARRFPQSFTLKLIQHLQKMAPLPATDPADGESVSLQLDQLLPRHSQVGRRGELQHVFVHVAAEVGRVVRVNRHLDALAQQADDLLALEVVGHDAVGDRARRQAQAAGFELRCGEEKR